MRSILICALFAIGFCAKCWGQHRARVNPDYCAFFSLDDIGEPFVGYPLTSVKVETRQIEEAEALLMDTLQREHLEPQRYFRQYVAGRTASGEHIIYVNALCRSGSAQHEDWKHRWLSVEDGGDCYWQAVINLDTGRVLLFQVNGNA